MSLLRTDHPGAPLPDVSGEVVSIEDLRAHRDHRESWMLMLEGLRKDARARQEESHAMQVAEDLFDLVIQGNYASAEVVSFHLLHEVVTFLTKVCGVDHDKLLETFKD